MIPDEIAAAAYTALGAAVQAYEPEAAALIIKSPAALLQILLEAGRRGAVAAAPAIRAAERQRLAAWLESDSSKKIIADAVREGMATERERIRHLAITHEAQYLIDRDAYADFRAFADLIGDAP